MSSIIMLIGGVVGLAVIKVLEQMDEIERERFENSYENAV